MNFLGKRFFVPAGIIFMLLGLGLFGASATFYLDPVQAVDFDRVKKNAISSCAASFDNQSTYMGLSTEVDGDKVFITAYGIEEWEGKIKGGYCRLRDGDLQLGATGVLLSTETIFSLFTHFSKRWIVTRDTFWLCKLKSK